MHEFHMELLFLLCFSLHNLEEALWLPAWSKYAEKYHKAVTENEFRFAVLIVTVLGYLITFQYFVFFSYGLSRYIYYGFVLMMVVNVFFPHLIAAFMLKRYAPGLVTGILLNAPVGIFLLMVNIRNNADFVGVAAACIIISITVLCMLKYLFIAGGKISQ